MRTLLIFIFTLTAFLHQPVLGQSSRSVVQAPGRHTVSGSNYIVNIPPDFVPVKERANEYVFQEKGSVIRFFSLENINSVTFCDSMTTSYFAAQKLTEVVQEKNGNVTIYKGKFNIERVPYIRAFYVIPDNESTVLGIANYPEKIEDELENQFVRMFKDHHDD